MQVEQDELIESLKVSINGKEKIIISLETKI
jgi:hypothetical protein